ncbi:hypothetical protein OHA72_36075 [Dactylosporangium sp. NBC_01737]|uniref:hypothetical protein n=1 Tax=Dactylosporangium sp. NBC_01737 TaxID=2975959 RepID=UPI002E14DCEB|nr:hypothetical protein OHA72_36075 [Dactylosporangium sp. NBC_01737]
MTDLFIAAVIEAGWFVAYAATLLLTWPPRPNRLTADASLPPATQVMLAMRVKDWVVPAVNATYASMMRRGWFAGHGNQVRLGPGDGRPLSLGEEQVLRHVSAVVGKSAEQSAPLHVLHEGPGAAENWEGFSNAVVGDARSRGLIRDRIAAPVYFLLVAGGSLAPVTYALTALEGDTRLAVGICAFLFSGGAHAWLLQATLRKLVLTRAGAAVAGPSGQVHDSPLTALRDDGTGWVHDDRGGWRQWRIQEPPIIRFSAWPVWIVYGAAILWTAGLLSVVSNSDSWDLGDLAMPLLYVYFGALGLRLLVGLCRAALMRRRRHDFERARTHVEGVAVRKFTRTYSVPDADGSHEQTDHHVVVYSGSGDMARDFVVGERVYDTVKEGQTRIRALPGWQSRTPDQFEVLPQLLRPETGADRG